MIREGSHVCRCFCHDAAHYWCFNVCASIEYRCAKFCLTLTFSFAVFFCTFNSATTTIFRFIQFLIQVGLHTYVGHIIDAIATKHLLCITELNLRYLHQLW